MSKKKLKLRNVATIACLAASVAFVGCDKKPKLEDPVNIGDNVYVVGYENTGQGGTTVAKLWNGETAQNLTDGAYTVFANSIYVAGSDVYVVGDELEELDERFVCTAKLWKNGVAQNLTDGTKFSSAQSVYVVGSDVYVAGYEGSRAKLWKNGIEQNLTDRMNSYAYSVCVSGKDVYVSGRCGIECNDTVCGLYVAKLWKNGVEQSLTDTILSHANFVFVAGNDVYVAGYGHNEQGIQVARLWKNGIAQDLTNGTYEAEARSVYVLGNDVYVVGEEHKKLYTAIDNTQHGFPVAVLWKNGIEQNLMDDAYAKSVYVSGGDVYIAGSNISGIPILWKNGQTLKLSCIKSGGASCVFVK